MRNLFIPPLGTEIELAEGWTFDLYAEHRNYDFFKYLGLGDSYRGGDESKVPVTLWKFSKLKIVRIYIRNGQKGFDSVTFRLTHHNLQKLKKSQRFWAKLEDVNKIMVV